MADGGYQRTCNKCQHTWLVPTALAEERPDFKSMAGSLTSLIGGNFNDQLALKAHFQQLGAAAKCPNCGATSFTQVKQPDVPDAPEAQTATPSAPSAAAGPVDAAADGAGFAAVANAPSLVPASAPQAPAAGQPGQPLTYVLNQQLLSLTGDLWIDDGQGNKMFEVDGKLLSLRGTHVLKDLNGQELYSIEKPLAPHLHKTVTISKGGQTVATVQEAIFHLGGDKFQISVAGGLELTIKGNWMNREFQVADQAGRVAIQVSRAWFSIHNGYGIQITQGFDVPLALAIVIALERVEAQEQGQESPIQNLLGGIGPF
jgi:uncharacterized protein YxjI